MNKLFKSDLVDKECRYINERCLHNCIYSKTLDNNITKIFLNKDLFYWESDMYLALVDNKFVPLASPSLQKIMYYTNNMMSLRSKLKSKNYNKKMILNEVFNFVNIFNKINFIHGNLHIDNIFVDKDDRFYVIDFTNSYYDKVNGDPKYKRRSFVDFNSEMTHYINYLDIFTLYISLKLFFQNNIMYIQYVDNLINIYIKHDILTEMLNKYKLIESD